MRMLRVSMLAGALSFAIAAQADEGCSKDTDCKGNRICDQHLRLCTEPLSGAAAAPARSRAHRTLSWPTHQQRFQQATSPLPPQLPACQWKTPVPWHWQAIYRRLLIVILVGSSDLIWDLATPR